MKNLKIGARLSVGFGAVLALMMLMTAIGIWRLQTVAQATRDMMQQPLAKERMISDWNSYINSGVRRTMAIAKSSDTELGSFFADDIATTTKASAELQKNIEPLIAPGAEQALWQTIMDTRQQYLSSRDSVVKAKADGQLEQANQILGQTFAPVSQRYLALMQDLLNMQRTQIDAAAKHIDDIAATSRTLLLVLGALAVALGTACAWLLTVGITRPLNAAVAVARTVASGDLTSRIEVRSGDETGQLLQALQEMNFSLQQMVRAVRTGTETIATATTQIAAGNLDLSSRTEAQASSLQETASSMEELTQIVKQNADNARQANSLAACASGVALRGGSAVGNVVQTMGSINDSSRRIADIIGVIDGIAFQTNILALNAAVEAARAGEQGRGFAVVASEVRNLAQRSAAAAHEIKDLINDSVAKVGTGAQQVNEAGTTMEEIVTSVKSVTDIMGEISAASAEQTAGIEQINQAINQMDQATQQNAALVEQAAAAAAALQDQAAKLEKVVSRFTLDAR